jgi:ATP-dependent Clp protease ATP-binding subunit ClpA
VKLLFKPEFRNRLDGVVYFSALPMPVVIKVVDKFIGELEAQLRERKITFDVSESAKQWLAKKGFDPVYGARPMARLIQKELKDRLADEILFGALCDGGMVKISCRNGKLEFKILEIA